MPISNLQPDALHEFARTLHKHQGRIQERTAAAKSNISNIGDLWKDDRYRKFEETFAVAMKDIEAFLSAMETHKVYVKKKAQLADRYLQKG